MSVLRAQLDGDGKRVVNIGGFAGGEWTDGGGAVLDVDAGLGNPEHEFQRCRRSGAGVVHPDRQPDGLAWIGDTIPVAGRIVDGPAGEIDVDAAGTGDCSHSRIEVVGGDGQGEIAGSRGRGLKPGRTGGAGQGP